MPVSLPVPTKNPGDVLTSALWNGPLRDNLNKLLNTGHRTLTVAQFNSIVGPEGTKGTVAGDEVYLEVDATNGILWHLVYESTETTYKWRFLGGPPMVATVLTSETTASGAFADLATVGPSITAPRGGDYVAKFGASHSNNTASWGAISAINVSGSIVGISSGFTNLGNNGALTHAALSLLPAVAAGATCKMQYHNNGGGTAAFSSRWLSVLPRRLV